MHTASSCTLLDAPPVRVRVSAFDETSELVEMLGRVMHATPPNSPGDIGMYVHSSATPPQADGLFDREGDPGSWRTYWILDRVLVRESPSRRTYLCGVPGYPGRYPTAQVRWHLASFIAGGVMALLSDRLLLVHGALIADGDAGHVLAGPSGAGKTTAAARVPPPWRGVADDMLAAIATEDGYALLPLPTWSVFDDDPDAHYSVETGRTFSLAGLWFLEPSPADAVASLSSTGAVQRLVNNALVLYSHYWSGFGPEDRARIKGNVLKHATRIVNQAPRGILKASRHGRFWEHLRAA